MSLNYFQTANQIISGALRIVGALAEKQSLDLDTFNEGLEALNALLNHLAETDEGLWRLSWGTQTFTASSAVSIGGKYYRCILGHTSSASTTPGTGANWTTYWYEDSSVSGSSAAWATATAYTCAGDFTFSSAHAITQAFIRWQNTDYPVKMAQFGQFLALPGSKYDEDIPRVLYFDRLNSLKIHLWPIPNSDVVSNGVLHLLTVDPISEVEDAGDMVPIPPTFVRALKYLLAADLADEKEIEATRAQRIEAKAQALWYECRKGPHADNSDMNGVKSCFRANRSR